MINNVFIRLNVGNKIGIGHLKRCLRLADEFSKKNIDCFIVSDKKKFKNRN